MKKKLTIDASRNIAGGAVNYLIGILENIPPNIFTTFEIVEVWTNINLISKLPKKTNVVYKSNYF